MDNIGYTCTVLRYFPAHARDRSGRPRFVPGHNPSTHQRTQTPQDEQKVGKFPISSVALAFPGPYPIPTPGAKEVSSYGATIRRGLLSISRGPDVAVRNPWQSESDAARRCATWPEVFRRRRGGGILPLVQHCAARDDPCRHTCSARTGEVTLVHRSRADRVPRRSR